jgi:hypothetical protein
VALPSGSLVIEVPAVEYDAHRLNEWIRNRKAGG